MKSLLLAMALAVGLAGCGPASDDGSTDPIATVQVLVEKTCSFVPTASSVAAMLAANNPAVQGTVAIATAICAAVTRKSVTPGDGSDCYGTVNGVCVEGKFKRE